MRLIAAIGLALFLAAFAVAGSAQRAAACSYLLTTGRPAFEDALAGAHLVVVGEVIKEVSRGKASDGTPRELMPHTSTIRVDATLKGESPGSHLSIDNVLTGGGDPDPRMEAGEYVILSLWWSFNERLNGVPVNSFWGMMMNGGKIVLTDDDAIVDQPYAEPRFTSIGDTKELIEELGARLAVPREDIDAILAAQEEVSRQVHPVDFRLVSCSRCGWAIYQRFASESEIQESLQPGALITKPPRAFAT